MSQNCKKSCPNYCNGGAGGGGSGVSACTDKKRECKNWASRGFCKGQYEQFMKNNCKKSCNQCGGGSGGNGGGGNGGGGNGGGGGSGSSGQCGYKPSARIVGGSEAPQGAWPWQAQIRSTSGFPFCGGTLVHPRWVVTAAHCTARKSARGIRIRLGAHYRTSNVGTEQDFDVERIVDHHSYKKPDGMANDISLLKLRKPAQLNRAVNLACLPGSSGSVAAGKMCWVTGFGRLSSGGQSPKVLMQVKVPVVSQSRCKSSYGSSIHDSMICAGLDAGGKDSCQGDSGGPMVCEYNGKYFLEGVVSWGHGCAAPRKYGVYARVRYLRDWISRVMNNY
ncbi:CUB and peptidase domain-containing protein 1 [Acropora cervicornis]|uniref:CUB and peptidase domain-containing protein 1 n=1 Tax=Acropora cervicornis TaxID=6130 RepID=A0AAD9QZ39_ACRCE|nr:CUB and peptidase domain-containing protein 1 [Acropora cervicornis]